MDSPRIFELGVYPEALEWYQRCLTAAEDVIPEEAARAWYGLATIDVNVGKYDDARNKFLEIVAIFQQIGYRADEADTWHNLASIDLRVSDYDAARDKFNKSLAINQQIGNRVVEAATFYQLGMLADKLGRLVEGARLVALCFLIDQSIGHGDKQSDWQALSQMAAQLNYTQEQVDAMLQEVSEAYEADRGAGLIQAAFKK